MPETTDTTQVLAELERAGATDGHKTVYQLLERVKPEIERALPAAIGADRFARLVLTEVRRKPQLLECDPHSLLGACMLAAQLGLEPGPLGHVYLVPYKREVTFIVGYKGMVELAYRSGLLRRIEAHVVRDGDDFEYRYGTRAFLDHRPGGAPGEREWSHVYALAELRTAGKPFAVLTPEEVEARRKRSPAGRDNKGPWATDTEAMWRKSAVRALQPWLPQTPEWRRALAADEQAAPPVEETVEGGDSGDE